MKAVSSKELDKKSSREKGSDIKATLSKLSQGEQVSQLHRDVKKEGGAGWPGFCSLWHLAGSSDQHQACPRGSGLYSL